jgi:hypothetical protein
VSRYPTEGMSRSRPSCEQGAPGARDRWLMLRLRARGSHAVDRAFRGPVRDERRWSRTWQTAGRVGHNRMRAHRSNHRDHES